MADGEIESTPRLAQGEDRAHPQGMASDNLWEQTFNAVSDPISIVDEDYRVIAANAAYKRLLGLPEDALAPHQCFADEGSDRACEGCPLDATIRTRAPHMFRQERLVKVAGDGNPRWERRVYHRWTYPIMGENGSVHRVVEILRDVTEQERLRELTTEAEALRRADHLKTELLGSVSHELRSPLTTIRGYAETLARHDRRITREERLEFLSAICEASDRLGDVIGRLLLLSRLESGDEVLEEAPIDMGRLSQEAILAIRGGARSRISLVINDNGATDRGRDQAPFLALGDPRRLREALDALLDNALKYTQETGRVEIQVRRAFVTPASLSGARNASEDSARLMDSERERRYIEVIVTDDGQGIPHESQPYIFDAFHRVETGLTRTVEGLGLGLAICKRIVTMSHGLLWVESAPGAGSAFHMLLPVYEAEEQGD